MAENPARSRAVAIDDEEKTGWQPPARQSPDRYKVLSLDGGGVKAYLTASVLHRICKVSCSQLERGEHCQFVEKTDMFTGTSAGAILAMMLAMGKSTKDILNFATTELPKIFQTNLWQNIEKYGGTIASKYSNEVVKGILEKVFGADTRMRDVEKPVFIITFHTQSSARKKENEGKIASWHPRYFTQFHEQDLDEKVVDVLMRTTAAPTYFPIYQGYIDGGVFANDPSMCAISSLMRHKTVIKSLDELRVLSVSTGTSWEALDESQVNADWGWVQWIQNDRLLDTLFKGAHVATQTQCESFLGDHYLRIDPELPQAVYLDDYEILPLLSEVAKSFPLEDYIPWIKHHLLCNAEDKTEESGKYKPKESEDEIAVIDHEGLEEGEVLQPLQEEEEEAAWCSVM